MSRPFGLRGAGRGSRFVPRFGWASANRLRIAALVAGALCLGCGCRPPHVARPYPAPTARSLLTDLQHVRDAAHSFRAESVMDYWVGDQRVKGTVLLMGRVGAYVRFNALNPTGGNVAADLACDGTNFKYVNYNNNCQLTGRCNGRAIAQLLRVDLAPDDFLLLAVGGTPILPDAGATLHWNASAGHEVLELAAADGRRQTIELAKADGGWDVVASTVRTRNGKVAWTLHNKDFQTATGASGQRFRVPGKTRFQQPAAKADLIVRWKSRKLNIHIDDSKFAMTIPAGLPGC